MLCSSCELVSYCSSACLAEDRSDHRPECAMMEDLSELPDITRITARLLLKLEEGGEEQCEQLPFSQGERSFLDLVSHEDKIEEADLCARQVFDCLSELIPAATGSWQHFKQVYGKLIINSFEISGQDDEKLGWALYIGPSILDHSCVPSAEVDFRGKNITIKSRVTMRPTDLSKNSICFIDRTRTFTERQETLSRQFGLSCCCSLCRDLALLTGRITSLLRRGQGGQKVSTCLVSCLDQHVTGKDRDYFRSVRWLRDIIFTQLPRVPFPGVPTAMGGRLRLVTSFNLPSAVTVTRKWMKKPWRNISRLNLTLRTVLKPTRR